MLQSLEDVNRRLRLNIDVLLLSRRPEIFRACWRGRHTQIKFIQGDVRAFVPDSERFDYVLHMASTSAAETYAGYSQIDKYDILTIGTRKVLEYAVTAGAKRLLFTSSGAAYGQTPSSPVDELTFSQLNPQLPESALGLGKQGAEFLCVRYAEASGLQTVIARCFSFVGPGLPLDLHYAIGNFIRNAVAGEPITVIGDGGAIRSYLFLGDMVVWLLTLLLDGKNGEMYNVGSDEAISIGDLARAVSALHTPVLKVQVLGNSTHQVGVPVRNVYVPNINKARKQLQLAVDTPLAEALQLTFAQARLVSTRTPT